MTFTELTTIIQDRLNLTSSTATTRIGLEINDRHRRVTSALGIATVKRTTVSKAVTIGNPVVTFTGVEKIINVVDRTAAPYRVLIEVTIEYLRNMQPYANSIPTYYAIINFTSSTVVVEFDCLFPVAKTLFADAYQNLATLSGTQTPLLPESFHDILMHGVLADEYRKMEKSALAAESEHLYERRLSDLRMWFAVSVYKDIVFGGITRDLIDNSDARLV
jgi:hypothetical protein